MITKYAELLKSLPAPIYKAAAQSWVDKDYPRHLFIETTASCNLSCSYCPREKIKNHMEWEVFTGIIDEATDYGPRSFSLHLFGEPLLYPHIWEAIRYIKKKDRRHTVLLTSNGTLFERFAKELISSPVDKVIWSWRPEAKFSAQLKERMRLWGKLTVRIIREEVPEEDQKIWMEWPSVEVRSLHNYGGNVDLSRFGVAPTDGKRYPCYHLWFAPAVSWNGKILMCCSDPQQKESFGTFPKTTVSDAWKQMEKVRESHMRGEYGGICAGCDVWKSYPDLFFSWQKR